MTIEEFIKDLQEIQQKTPGLEVILSKDAEGNGFSPYSEDWSIGLYEAESTWYGEFTSELEDDEKPNAIVLWPVN